MTPANTPAADISHKASARWPSAKVVGGGIAAYKACELVRLVRKGGGDVTCVVTDGGQQFVTPMELAEMSEHPVYPTLWTLKNESAPGIPHLIRKAALER